MGAVASKRRRRRAGERTGGGGGGQQHAPVTVTPTLVVGLGDPMLDLILGTPVPHERLRDLGIERGGCVQVPSAEIDALLDALDLRDGGTPAAAAASDQPLPPDQHPQSQNNNTNSNRPEGVPGGSAANVIKGLAGLARATGADASGELRCRFAGMIARDSAGGRYASALAAEGVEPLLLVAGEDGEEEGGEAATTSDARSTARCLCLVAPDGERTMRTCLGAAAGLRSAERQLAPRRWLELGGGGGAGKNGGRQQQQDQPQKPYRLLLHLEGYALYRPELAAGALRAARAAQKRGAAAAGGAAALVLEAKTSLDLASFELVRARWRRLLDLLQEGLVDCLFCNEDEAAALAEVAGLQGGDGGDNKDDDDDRRARAAAKEEASAAAAEAARAGKDGLPPTMCPAAAAAQRYLVERGAGLCVVSLGARGCAALARTRRRRGEEGEEGEEGEGQARGAAAAPAAAAASSASPIIAHLERARAPACALRSPLVDTVGAGDTFTAGFLFAWLRGRELADCCALACASGAEVVQVAGASLGAGGWARAWASAGGVGGDGGGGGGASAAGAEFRLAPGFAAVDDAAAAGVAEAGAVEGSGGRATRCVALTA